MLPIVIGAIAAVVVVRLIVVALQPVTFEVTPSAAIAAPPQTVFNQINSLRQRRRPTP